MISVVLSLPEELTDDLHQAVTFVSHLLSWLTPRRTDTSDSTNPPVVWCTGPFSGSLLLLDELMLLWLWTGATYVDSTDWWCGVGKAYTSFTNRLGFYMSPLNVAHISLWWVSCSEKECNLVESLLALLLIITAVVIFLTLSEIIKLNAIGRLLHVLAVDIIATHLYFVMAGRKTPVKDCN